MMVELRLVEVDPDYVTYDIYDHDCREYVSQMKMDRRDKSFVIDGNRTVIKSKFEAHACRILEKLVDSKEFSSEIYHGWG